MQFITFATIFKESFPVYVVLIVFMVIGGFLKIIISQNNRAVRLYQRLAEQATERADQYLRQIHEMSGIKQIETEENEENKENKENKENEEVQK